MSKDIIDDYPDIVEKIEAAEKNNKANSKLLYWSDGQRAIPNDIGRSALFIDYKKGKRPFLDNEIIWSRKEIKMTFRGHGLDQSDASLFLELLHLQRNKPFGKKIFVRKSDLLNSIKVCKGGNQYKLLDKSLDRLQGNLKIIKSFKNQKEKILLSGPLLSLYGTEENTNNLFFFKLDKDVANLFSNNNYALLMYESRSKLNGLSKALQMHIATSSSTKQSFFYEDINKRLGRNSEIRYLKRDLRIACKQLKDSKVIFDYDFKKEKLHIVRRKITEQ